MTRQLVAAKLALLARQALLEELRTYPKPGLVSHIDNGSHDDMDYSLFTDSIASLGGYFYEIALAGCANREFAELETLGLTAEKTMLNATNNINTHRGAIFILGLLVAATAYSIHQHYSLSKLQQTLIKLYAKPLEFHKLDPNSHGSKIRQQYQLKSIIEIAQEGFPPAFDALAAFNHDRTCYNDESATKLKLFFRIMHRLDDTNLVYRGGIKGLKLAQSSAGKIIELTSAIEIQSAALALHHEFIRLNLSPGGSADMFAAALFIDKVQCLWG